MEIKTNLYFSVVLLGQEHFTQVNVLLLPTNRKLPLGKK